VAITHQLRGARSADRIVVIVEGRIAEQGNHDELITAGGPYAELYATWSAARQPSR
jgi:ATP-binding cassette, subfamily C, bacterial